MKIGRFDSREITLKRIFNSIIRRFTIFPDKLFWTLSNHNNLLQFKDSHKGEVCYLIANGPSLNETEMSLLKDKVTFGMNRIYLLFEKMGFTTSYYTCVNELVLKQFSKEIGQLEMPKFLNYSQRNLFKKSDESYFIFRKLGGTEFGTDISKSINQGSTITYAALQIIYYMGFSKVVIVGLDHSFSFVGQVNETQVNTDEDKNHFVPNYFPKGSKWQTPDLVSSEYFYQMADDMFRKAGREIIDCTVGGKCFIFKKDKLVNHI